MSVRTAIAAIGVTVLLGWTAVSGAMAAERPAAGEILRDWYYLMNELVRHTAT